MRNMLIVVIVIYGIEHVLRFAIILFKIGLHYDGKNSGRETVNACIFSTWSVRAKALLVH